MGAAQLKWSMVLKYMYVSGPCQEVRQVIGVPERQQSPPPSVGVSADASVAVANSVATHNTSAEMIRRNGGPPGRQRAARRVELLADFAVGTQMRQAFVA
jgi:hypothetical protein